MVRWEGTLVLEKQSQLRCEIATPGQIFEAFQVRIQEERLAILLICRLVRSYYFLDYTWQFYGWAVTRK